jgi:hypothetical protein
MPNSVICHIAGAARVDYPASTSTRKTAAFSPSSTCGGICSNRSCYHSVLLAHHNPTKAPRPLNSTPHSDSRSAPHNSGMKPAIVEATKIAIHVRIGLKPEVHFFAFRPISTSRRMASERSNVGSVAEIHLSMALSRAALKSRFGRSSLCFRMTNSAADFATSDEMSCRESGSVIFPSPSAPDRQARMPGYLL